MTDYRSTKAFVHLDRLRKNFKILTGIARADQDFFAIVKADAYGHGAVAVAQTLNEWGVRLFGVATLDEGCALREQGILGQIFVLDGLQGPLAAYRQHDLIPVLHAPEELLQVCQDGAGRLPVALKFDTCMGRLGFLQHEVSSVLQKIKSSDLPLRAVFTHLARADESADWTTEPAHHFADIVKAVQQTGFSNVRFSFHNSAATLDGVKSVGDWYRPGLALYGCYPHERQKKMAELEPVLEWKSVITSLKDFPAGAPIGYGGTFVTRRASRIAIVAAGYADGYNRSLSNTGFVLVRGKRAPVVGRVSMDLTAIDVTDIESVCYGDGVTLIGQDGTEKITAEDVAAWAGTISYEILCGISKRVPRVHLT